MKTITKNEEKQIACYIGKATAWDKRFDRLRELSKVSVRAAQQEAKAMKVDLDEECKTLRKIDISGKHWVEITYVSMMSSIHAHFNIRTNAAPDSWSSKLSWVQGDLHYFLHSAQKTVKPHQP